MNKKYGIALPDAAHGESNQYDNTPVDELDGKCVSTWFK